MTQQKNMNFISAPFGYLFKFFFDQTNNYLLSVIFLALIMHIILFLLDIKQRKNARILNRITPDINKLKEKYPNFNDDQNQSQKFQQELNQLYKENHYSGLTGCFSPILNLLFVIILYNIMTRPLTFLLDLSPEIIESLKNTLTEQGITISNYMQLDIMQYLSSCNQETLTALLPDISIANIPNMMLGQISLGIKPSLSWPLILIPIFACISTFLSTLPNKLLNKNQTSMSDIMSQSFDMGMKDNTENQTQEKQEEIKKLKKKMGKFAGWGLQIYSSALTVFISFKLPVIVAFYWMFRSVFNVIKDLILHKTFPPEENTTSMSKTLNNMPLFNDLKKNDGIRS